jgi:hypothetical protein
MAPMIIMVMNCLVRIVIVSQFGKTVCCTVKTMKVTSIDKVTIWVQQDNVGMCPWSVWIVLEERIKREQEQE